MDEKFRQINDIEPQLFLSVIENMDHRMGVYRTGTAKVLNNLCFVQNKHRSLKLNHSLVYL